MVFAIGILMLIRADSVTDFYVVEAILGLAYGVYVGIACIVGAVVVLPIKKVR